MSIDVEVALLTKIIETEDLRSVVRSKVTPSFFLDEDARDIFEYMAEVYQKRGRIPSLSLLQNEYPDFEPEESDDDILLLIDAVKDKKLYADLQRTLSKVADETRGDPTEGLAALKKMSVQLASIHSTGEDLDLTKCGDDLRAELEKLKNTEGTLGIPWPWEALNRATLGIHLGEFIAFYARPKSMKTWVMLYVAYWIWKQTGKSILFLTKEMTPEQIRRRWAAMACELEYSAFREGRLNEDEEIRFHDFLDQIEDEGEAPFIVSTVEEQGAPALTEIQAKIEDFQADMVFVDGLYFLAEDPSWKSFTVITRGLKQLAQQKKVAIIGTTQANRSAEKGRGALSEVAFGDSLAMDVDVLIRIIREGQHRDNNELLMTLPALREAHGCTFTINALPAHDFTQKHEFEQEEGSEALNSTDDGAIL